MDEEQQWITRAQQGDARAYESLVRRYEQIAFRAAWLITRDEREAADAAQDAFVRAYRALGSFKRAEPFRPWLLRIVTNQALNRVKSLQRRAHMTERFAQQELIAQNDPAPERAVVTQDQSARLREVVDRLAPEERALIAFRYFLEMPEQEVAAALNIPLGTVKSRLHRTLARLREIITREFPDLQDLVVE